MRLAGGTVGIMMGIIGFLAPQPRTGQPGGAPVAGYEVVRSYPHDPHAFTQGLVFRDGFFYEGTGMNGQSGIRKVDPETGEVLQIKAIDQQYFGEGITDWKDSLIEFTWQSGTGFVYDL